MRVVAFNGSPREKGNTSVLLGYVLEELESAGIETERVQVGGRVVRGCIACYKCFERKNRKCSQVSDQVNEWIDLMLGADGILLGSPTYFANVSPEMKALIDRAGLVAKGNDSMLARKAGAGVVAVRRAGAIHVFNSLNHFFTIGGMIVPGSTYWNIGIGRLPGEVADDPEGIRTMRDLGRNMAWLLEKTAA